jgi:hypothetical protein
MKMIRSIKAVIILIYPLLCLKVSAGEIKLESPDKNISVRIENNDRIKWSVIYKGRTIVPEGEFWYPSKNGTVLQSIQ